VNNEVEDSASVDLDLMVAAADETLDGNEDTQSVTYLKDDWPDVVGQEQSETVSTAAGGQQQGRARAGGVDDDDDDAVFGEMIVRELRHISDPETKLLLRHSILTTIYETRLDCIEWTRTGGSGGQHPVRLPWPSVRRRGRQGDGRSTVNGCRWTSLGRDASQSTDRQNHDIAGDGVMEIKEETE